MPTNLLQAQQMIDLFTSVGATRFNVTFLDLLAQKTRYFPQRTPPSMRYNLPSWMAEAALRRPCKTKDGQEILAGESITIRPVCCIPETAVTFVQLDDLKTEILDRVRPASFLIFSTSPGNHQAWIAVSGYKGDTVSLCRRVRKALGAGDKSATGSTRLAGSENFKSDYAPDFPLVHIIHGVPGRVMTVQHLQDMGLLAEPEITPIKTCPPRVSPAKPSGKWPSYAIELSRAPLKENAKPDRSTADINWCMIALSWNHSVDDVAAKLLDVSEKAYEQVYLKKDEKYALMTARKAARYVDENRQRGRSRA
jgi:hypothetical protein